MIASVSAGMSEQSTAMTADRALVRQHAQGVRAGRQGAARAGEDDHRHGRRRRERRGADQEDHRSQPRALELGGGAPRHAAADPRDHRPQRRTACGDPRRHRRPAAARAKSLLALAEGRPGPRSIAATARPERAVADEPIDGARRWTAGPRRFAVATVGAARRRAIGVFTTDLGLEVRTWDAWLARARPAFPPERAVGRPLLELVPDLAERGLLARLRAGARARHGRDPRAGVPPLPDRLPAARGVRPSSTACSSASPSDRCARTGRWSA